MGMKFWMVTKRPGTSEPLMTISACQATLESKDVERSSIVRWYESRFLLHKWSHESVEAWNTVQQHQTYYLFWWWINNGLSYLPRDCKLGMMTIRENSNDHQYIHNSINPVNVFHCDNHLLAYRPVIMDNNALSPWCETIPSKQCYYNTNLDCNEPRYESLRTHMGLHWTPCVSKGSACAELHWFGNSIAREWWYGFIASLAF